MRRAARTDDNQPEIVEAFRKMGCSVQPLHQVGGGCTDLAVGKNGINVMVEIKDGKKPPSERKLTDDQVRWHESWRGWKEVVESIEDCQKLVARIEVASRI